MRLIDAGKLIEIVKEAENKGETFCIDSAEELEWFLDDNAFTIERKRGQWIKHDEERDYCSLCKCIFKTRTLTKQDKWTTYVDDLCFHFCPNCGAKMKGADNEM